MSKMIPSLLSDDTRSDAERDLFVALRDEPGTDDWVVLHSLNLTARDKKPFGEVDFVLLAPGGGVFAIEVKGGGVECADGVWTSVDRKGSRWPLKRSPFKQAQEGMWQLRDCLLKAVGASVMDKVVFGSAAIFPDSEFKTTSPEWAEWEVLDKRACARSLVVALQKMMTGHATRLRLDGNAFTPAVLSQARQVLRPDFECVMAAVTTLKLVEQQLLKLTEEQFGALDLMKFNERMLCEGAAGTGKTMLALELARREARKGIKTLLLCYNRLLGTWLAAQTKGEPNLTAGSFHQLGRGCIEAQGLLGDFNVEAKKDGFWDRAFPELAWQAIAESGASFDALIIDEAQDLSAPLILDVLDAWLTGGLTGGRWAFFADFERQAIFAGEQHRTTLLTRAPGCVRWRLTLNCRNTKRIARETALLSGFERPPYRMGQIDGVPVDSTFYTDQAEAATKLAARITKFIADGGSPDDLVILSPRKLANSCATAIQKGHGFVLLDANEAAPERSRQPIVRFATVQSFKGMESQAVILCDVASLGDDEQQSLLYVGMSRARIQLTLILKSDLRHAFNECRAKQFSAEWK
jgi:hypothetical protein